MREFPATSNVNYSNTVSSGGDWLAGALGAGAQNALPHAGLMQFQPRHITTNTTTTTTEQQMSTRILRVILADPDENLPVEKRVLFQGPEKLTDLTDQELFFELPVQDLLAKHNERARRHQRQGSVGQLRARRDAGAGEDSRPEDGHRQRGEPRLSASEHPPRRKDYSARPEVKEKRAKYMRDRRKKQQEALQKKWTHANEHPSTNGTTDVTVEEYVKARDEALLKLDLDHIRNQLGRPASDEMCLLVAHKARYEAVRLPVEARLESARWLRERGYKRMTGTELLPEGQLPE
jgi:hypothetical protein